MRRQHPHTLPSGLLEKQFHILSESLLYNRLHLLFRSRHPTLTRSASRTFNPLHASPPLQILQFILRLPQPLPQSHRLANLGSRSLHFIRPIRADYHVVRLPASDY